MKLLLQVLFAQGWLWRDRFPHIYAKAKVEHRGAIGYLILLLSAVLLLMGILSIADGDLSRGILVPVAGTWLLWALSSHGLRADVGRKELRLSVVWALGFLFAVSICGLLLVGLVTVDWWLLLLTFVFIVCFVTGWLRGIQRIYLLFRDPANNAWRLEGPKEPPKGFMRAYTDAIVETYWRLPREILFPRRERHAQ
jgi:hypothetical protein